MRQLLCGELYLPLPLIHRERGLTVELLSISYSTASISEQYVVAVLRRILRDKIFVFEDEASVYSADGEFEDGSMEFHGDGWRVQLPADRIEMIPVVASTPPRCFRCALSAYMAARIAAEEEIGIVDGGLEVLGVNVVRSPGRDVFTKMGLHRALIQPLHELSISRTSISALSAFRIGYVEEAVETDVRAPHMIIDIREHSGDVELPASKFAKLEYETRVRSMLLGTYDFGRALVAFGEPEHEFTLATCGDHTFRMIK